MAIFLLKTRSISRSRYTNKGRSPVDYASYIAREKLTHEKSGKVFDRSHRADEVLFKGITLPSQWSGDARAKLKWDPTSRQTLWNTAEQTADQHKDLRRAREIIVALPAELSADQRRELALQFSQKLADRYKAAVDVALHKPNEKDSLNYHAHLLMTARELTETGLGDKTRIEYSIRERRKRDIESFDEEIGHMNGYWAEIMGKALERAGLSARISPTGKTPQAAPSPDPPPPVGTPPAAAAADATSPRPIASESPTPIVASPATALPAATSSSVTASPPPVIQIPARPSAAAAEIAQPEPVSDSQTNPPPAADVTPEPKVQPNAAVRPSPIVVSSQTTGDRGLRPPLQDSVGRPSLFSRLIAWFGRKISRMKAAFSSAGSTATFMEAPSGKDNALPDGVRGNYVRLGNSGTYIDGNGHRVFEIRGRKVFTRSNEPSDVVAATRAAIWVNRGRPIKVKGTHQFRREVWLTGSSLGVAVKDYDPSGQDRRQLAERIAEHSRQASPNSHNSINVSVGDATAPVRGAAVKTYKGVKKEQSRSHAQNDRQTTDIADYRASAVY